MNTWEEALQGTEPEFNKWFEKEFVALIKECVSGPRYSLDYESNPSEWLENFKANLYKAWKAGYIYRSEISGPSKEWLDLMALGY
jgi:hypothetical protein